MGLKLIKKMALTTGQQSRRHLQSIPLRRGDLQALLDFSEWIAFITDADSLHEMLAGLAELIGADAATLTHIGLNSRQELAMIWPKPKTISQLRAESAALGGNHPVRRLLIEQARSDDGPPAAIRISDLSNIRQWRTSGLHSGDRPGVGDQLCLLLGAGPTAIQVLMLTRHLGQFTDRQAALLTAGQGHLSATVQRVGQQPRPLLQLEPQLRWVIAPIAIPQLRYRGGNGQVGSINSDSAAGDGDLPGMTSGPPLIGRPVTSGAGSTLPATARQQQILGLAAEGLTDAQIGRRLALSPATVSKHLSRAYTRLGVPNRAAAVRLLGADAAPPPHRSLSSA